MSAGSRAHNTVSCRNARWPASAVPHAPAPRTASFIAGTACDTLVRDAVLRRAFLAAQLRETLFVQRLEVDFGQVDGWEAGAGDGVGDVRAQVREQDGRARNADERILPLAADRGTAAMINLPFGRGRLFNAVQGKKLPEWAAEFDCKTWAQFFL